MFNKDLEEIKKGKSIMNNAITEINSPVEGTNSRIIEAEDRISEMEDCSPELLATSILQQRPSIVKTNSMLQKISKQIKDRSPLNTWLRLGVRQYMYGARKILKYEKGKNLKTTIKLSELIKTKDYSFFCIY